MIDKANQDIRKAAADNGIRLWQIAKHLGMRDDAFSRLLREELSEDLKEKILQIIENMKKSE